MTRNMASGLLRARRNACLSGVLAVAFLASATRAFSLRLTSKKNPARVNARGFKPVPYLDRPLLQFLQGDFLKLHSHGRAGVELKGNNPFLCGSRRFVHNIHGLLSVDEMLQAIS